MRRILPAAAGVLTATAVAATGLALTAPGPVQTVAASGTVEVPEPPYVATPPAEPEDPWTPPPLPPEEILEEMDQQEYLEALTTQADPREPNPETQRAVGGGIVVGGGPIILFGQSGWDSSRYPESPPVVRPSGFQLYWAEDGVNFGRDRDREWSYWHEKGHSSLQSVCLQMVAAMTEAGFQPSSGSDCQSDVPEFWQDQISEQYWLLGYREDGAAIDISLDDAGAPCISVEGGNCPQLRIALWLP